jgi:uncharacterized membrane protein YeaQ/YmgE (transglycosylase-associated protein family)
MEAILPLILQLVGGAGGGNVIAKLLKNLDLGPLGNTVVGLIGGFSGGQLVGLLGQGAGGADPVSLLLSLLGGGVGGGVLTAIVGLVKNVLLKK